MKTPEQIADEVFDKHWNGTTSRTLMALAIRADRAQRDTDEVARKVWTRQDFLEELEQRGEDYTPEQKERIVDDAVSRHEARALADCTEQDWDLVNAALDLAMKGA